MIEGWNGTSNLTLLRGDLYVFHAKCYYDPDNPPAGFGAGHSFFDGTALEPTCVAMTYAPTSGVNWYSAAARATGPYTTNQVDSYTSIALEDSGVGYVAFQMQVYGTYANASSDRVWQPMSYRNISFGYAVNTSCSTTQHLGITVSGSGVGDSSEAGWMVATPYYRWGGTFAPGCAAYFISTTTRILRTGEEGEFAIYASPDPPDPTQIEFRYRASDEWQPVLSTLDGETYTYPVQFLARLGPGSNADAQVAQFRCTTASGVVSYTQPGATTWTSPVPQERACNRSVLRWPADRQYEVGDLAAFTLETTGVNPANVLLSYSMWDADHDEDGKFDRAAADWTPTVLGSMSTVHGQLPFVLIAEYAGGPNQFQFRCVDDDGIVYDGSFGYGVEVDGVANDDCYEGSGLTLAPASWLPALLHGVACVARSMVEPSPDVIDEFITTGRETFVERVPFSYFSEAAEFTGGILLGTPDAIEAHINDCITTLAGLDAAGVPAQVICPRTGTLSLTDSLVVYRNVFGYIVWGMFGWRLWCMTRRVFR